MLPYTCYCPRCLGGREHPRSPQSVRVETWQSNENRKEIHIFVKGHQETYLIGFNPQLVPEAKIKKILKELGFEI